MGGKRNAAKSRHQTRQTGQSSHLARLDILDKIYKESLELNDDSPSLAPNKFLERHEYLFSLIQQLRGAEKDLNPKLSTRDGESWKKFFQWIDKCQSSVEGHKDEASGKISASVDIIDHKDQIKGYGLLSKKSVSKNQLICKIPLSCMLTTETATQDRKLAKFIESDPILSDMPNVVLVMHLLNEHSKGDNSRWFPYLSILPPSHSTIFYLNWEQMNHLKASNHMYDVVKMIRAITRQYAYFYSKLQATDLPLRDKLTYELYCWGVSTVCTRQQELPATDGKRYPTMNALIPILDMCNHKEESLPPVYDEGNLKINASDDVKPGDEIFIFYGYRSSGNFFVHNGFVPTRVDKDFLPLILGMNKLDDMFQRRNSICRLLKWSPAGRFRLNDRRDLLDTHLAHFLVVLLMNKQELDYILNHQDRVNLMEDITNFIIVDYKQDEENSLSGEPDDRLDKLTIGRRLKVAIQKYLSQRAMIYEKVIDRALQEINGSDQLTKNIIALLKHEKSILAGYCSS